MSSPTPHPSPWWDVDRHRDRRARLIARNAIKSAIRAWFEAQGFVEVEPGIVQVSPGNEAHLHAFATDLVGTDLARRKLYLNTSPEFAMKKLVAAGEKRIFAFQPCFRNRERGALHAPEFTMLEWYRVGEGYETLWEDCIAILRIAAGVTGRTIWSWRPERFRDRTAPPECDVMHPFLSGAVDTMFHAYAGLDLWTTYSEQHTDRDALAAKAVAAGIKVGANDTWADIFARVLTEKIEPYLGRYAPEVLHWYPRSEAALARPVTDHTRCAERFELYCCGIELANGFGELVDAAALRANLEAEMRLKEARYGERYPIDEDFLAAVAAMPPTSGCALGFDRLVMLATGARSVDDVIWTPFPAPDEG